MGIGVDEGFIQISHACFKLVGCVPSRVRGLSRSLLDSWFTVQVFIFCLLCSSASAGMCSSSDKRMEQKSYEPTSTEARGVSLNSSWAQIVEDSRNQLNMKLDYFEPLFINGKQIVVPPEEVRKEGSLHWAIA